MLREAERQIRKKETTQVWAVGTSERRLEPTGVGNKAW